MARSLTGTRSSGVSEVLWALYQARAYGGNKVTVASILRHLPAHTLSADVTTVLNSEISASHVVDGGGTYGLTSAGLTYLRGHKPRGRIAC